MLNFVTTFCLQLDFFRSMGYLTKNLTSNVVQLIAENGLSWNEARKKLLRSGIAQSVTQLPTDEEIESGLREYFAIFDPLGHELRLKAMRFTALSWMKRLSQYSPRLTKGVLNGCADRFSNIYIQLFAENPKELEIALVDLGCEYEVTMPERNNPKEPEEIITFTAPYETRHPDGDEQLAGIVLEVFSEPFNTKRKEQKTPDSHQTENEARLSANIEQLEALLQEKYL